MNDNIQGRITDLVRTKLQETGDLERLRCYLRRRLVASGWKTEMQKELRARMTEIEYQTLTVEEIYNKILESGIIIDGRIKEEMCKKIKHCYKEALDDGGKQIDDVMKNVSRKNYNVPNVKENRYFVENQDNSAGENTDE